MNPKPIEDAKNPDLRGSYPAMQRAALRARELAMQTGTVLVMCAEPDMAQGEAASNSVTPISHPSTPDR
jgi:hypothetical protein